MKRPVAGLLALLLGLALGGALAAWLADATVLNPARVLLSVPAATYPQLTRQLPAALGQLTPLSADERAIIAQQLDPGLVRQIAQSAITQQLEYLHGSGRTPMIDLRPVSGRLRQEGAPLPADLYARLDSPISLGNRLTQETLVPLVGWLDRWRWLGLIAAAGLAGLIWLLGAHWRYRTLAKGALMAALAVVLAVLFCRLAPALIASQLGTSPLAALAPTIKTALMAVVATYQTAAWPVIAALAAGGFILGGAHLVLGRRPKRHH